MCVRPVELQGYKICVTSVVPTFQTAKTDKPPCTYHNFGFLDSDHNFFLFSAIISSIFSMISQTSFEDAAKTA